MNCFKCLKDFPEKDIQLSHDVPKYMFEEKKEADWHGRHYLCIRCHNKYEKIAFSVAFRSLPDSWKEHARKSVKEFAGGYFRADGNGKDT